MASLSSQRLPYGADRPLKITSSDTVATEGLTEDKTLTGVRISATITRGFGVSLKALSQKTFAELDPFQLEIRSSKEKEEEDAKAATIFKGRLTFQDETSEKSKDSLPPNIYLPTNSTLSFAISTNYGDASLESHKSFNPESSLKHIRIALSLAEEGFAFQVTPIDLSAKKESGCLSRFATEIARVADELVVGFSTKLRK
ncbi:MAG: hypothetical protein S4CHLAM6_08200 [Chlamydiae bacterium]|nr:hypothetical protein [Chlamydiota bacterium]